MEIIKTIRFDKTERRYLRDRIEPNVVVGVADDRRGDVLAVIRHVCSGDQIPLPKLEEAIALVDEAIEECTAQSSPAWWLPLVTNNVLVFQPRAQDMAEEMSLNRARQRDSLNDARNTLFEARGLLLT